MHRRTFVSRSATGVAASYFLPGLWLDAQSEDMLPQKVKVPQSAKFIWINGWDTSRNRYVNFRKSFELSSLPTEATFSIFADTSYQLFVNGEFVEFGPVRFDPRYPVYDTHDLSKYLKVGKNCIAIQANYFGCKVYKSIANVAGMICWGSAKAGNQVIDLSSNPALWKVAEAKEHSAYVNKMSFALNPADLFIQKDEIKKWNSEELNDTSWANAVAVKDQKKWGELTARPIPFMAGNSVSIQAVSSLLPLDIKEDRYSFFRPIPQFFEENQGKRNNSNRQYVPYYTYIYSEKDQQINVGRYWGENWLNGVEQKSGVATRRMGVRINEIWTLKKGWNYLFGKVVPYFDILTHYFAFPTNKGIWVSAHKDKSSPVLFKVGRPCSDELFNKYLQNKPLPFAEGETLSEIGGWQDITAEDKAQSPIWEVSWDFYDAPLEKTPSVDELQGYVFKKDFYPNGFYLLLDLDYMHLVLPQMHLQGVKGATIDITYSERMLTEDKQFLYFNYQAGDRVVCSEDELKWMPTHPRGMRYCALTVRNTPGDVVLKNLNFRSANYPVKKIGAFECSDPLLNEIWKACARTEEIVMEDAYVDCASRERGMYLRDTIIQYHNNLVAFGDQALMRRCMELYCQSPDATGKFRAVYPNTGDYTIADFSLNALEGLEAYYRQTGDKSLIKTYWNAIVNNMKWFDQLADERPADLLLDAEWHIKRKIKAHYGGFHGDLGIVPNYLSIKGIHCMFSCNYLISLKAAKYLADEIGMTAYSTYASARIKILEKSIFDLFWDEAKGCFADNDKKQTYSAHASLFAVRAGVPLSEKQRSRVRNKVKMDLRSLFVNGHDPDSGVYVSPSFAFYIFEGLYLLDLPEVAENLIRQGWSVPLIKGIKTTPEYFHFRDNNSLSHGWSASPMYYLSKNILGVQFPKAPNMNVIVVDVKAGSDIYFAKGKFPHPKGVVEIEWHLDENGKRIFDKLAAPAGVSIQTI